MPDRHVFLVTGCRSWNVGDIAQRVIEGLIARHDGNRLLIIHGDATGVDRSFREACERLGVDQVICPANWNGVSRPDAQVRHRDGKPCDLSAGPRRNALMLEIAKALGVEFCLAVHKRLAASKGTANMVNLCHRAGIPVYLIDGKEARPKRIGGTNG